MKYFNGQVEEFGSIWRIIIRKPIFATQCAIREKILMEAYKRGKMLLVECPDGQEFVSPATWMNEGKKISKVFLQPDNPMILFQRAVKLASHKKPIEEFLKGGEIL